MNRASSFVINRRRDRVMMALLSVRKSKGLVERIHGRTENTKQGWRSTMKAIREWQGVDAGDDICIALPFLKLEVARFLCYPISIVSSFPQNLTNRAINKNAQKKFMS